jgi:hypothetical protein
MGAGLGPSWIVRGSHSTRDVLGSTGFVYLSGHLTGELLDGAGSRLRDDPS